MSSSPGPTTSTANRIPSLDGFRAIAIVMVIAHHAFDDRFTLFSGHFGVSIFFVISGFLITTLLLDEQSAFGRISLKNFYIRRVLRIFPVAYLYLLFIFLLNLVVNLAVPLYSLLQAAFYLKNTSIYYSPDWYTGHYWSLSVEEQFYLIFPFLLKKSERAFVITSVLLLLIIPVASYVNARGFIHNYLFVFICEILRNLSAPIIGSLLAIAVFRNKINLKIPDQYKSIMTLALLMAAAVLHSDIIIKVPVIVALVPIAAMIFINLSSYNGIVYQLLNSRPLMWIGVLSYSLYIWQQFFTRFPWDHLYPDFINPIWIDLVLLVGVAWLSYNLFEKPLLRLRKKFSTGEIVKSEQLRS